MRGATYCSGKRREERHRHQARAEAGDAADEVGAKQDGRGVDFSGQVTAGCNKIWLDLSRR